VPIGKPDAIPRKIWRKKKDRGKADARALTGAEIAERAHHEREAAYRKAIAIKDASATPPGSPRLPGGSQYGTTIDLAVQPLKMKIYLACERLHPPSSRLRQQRSDDSETDTILTKKMKWLQEENETKDARLRRLEATVDKLMQQSCQEVSS
jgi:hypothetical protein